MQDIFYYWLPIVGVCSFLLCILLNVVSRTRDYVPPPGRAVPPEPRDYTLEDLKQFDGTDRKKPVLMAIKGQVFDVTPGRDFYGPGGPYAVFAGKEPNRALAKMSTSVADCVPDTTGLSYSETDVLDGWFAKFTQKYAQVGQVVAPTTNASSMQGKAPTADKKAD